MAITDIELKNAKPGDVLRDGTDGLYCVVSKTRKTWLRDFRLAGKSSSHTLGQYPAMSLKEARKAAGESRRLVADGFNPNEQKRAKADKAALEALEARQALRAQRLAKREQQAAEKAQRSQDRATVQRVADQWIEASELGWTVGHAAQVRQSLEDHLHPKIGKKPMAEVTTDDLLMLVLQPMLKEGKLETCSRVYQRICSIWEWARLRGLTKDDPAAKLRREFSRLKKAARKVNPRRNFAAVDTKELPALLRAIDHYRGDTVTRLAIQLLVLTLTRTGELRQARWTEFVLDGPEPTWTVPVERLKVKLRGDYQAQPHIVPLSTQAVAKLRELRRVSGFGPLVFPQSRKRDKPISENAVLYALAGLGYAKRQTGHGFRAIASTWLHDAGWPHAAIELQLAHEKADRTSAAYDRSDHLPVRRRMMQAYGDAVAMLEKQLPQDAATDEGVLTAA